MLMHLTPLAGNNFEYFSFIKRNNIETTIWSNLKVGNQSKPFSKYYVLKSFSFRRFCYFIVKRTSKNQCRSIFIQIKMINSSIVISYKHIIFVLFAQFI